MSDMCRLCDAVAKHVDFCHWHVTGWVNSEQRKQIDWEDEKSYFSAVEAYADQFNVFKAKLEAGTEEEDG